MYMYIGNINECMAVTLKIALGCPNCSRAIIKESTSLLPDNISCSLQNNIIISPHIISVKPLSSVYVYMYYLLS